MKNVTITVLVVLLIIIAGLYFVSYQVRETESALVITMGKATAEKTEPGLKFKWPAPIQRIEKFDSRMRVYSPEMEETTTKGEIPVIVDTYIVWKIAEPLNFYNGVQTVPEAEKLLRAKLRSTQNNVIGQHYFSEFVNRDKTKIRFGQIQQEMLDEMRQAVSEMGIDVSAMGIKQLKVNEVVTKEVFARMASDRGKMSADTIARGNAEATRIRTDAESKRTELLAVAEARAKAIRGQGDAEAAKYYKQLEADPELAIFLRNLDALKKILAERTTILLGTDIEPINLLKEIPNLDGN